MRSENPGPWDRIKFLVQDTGFKVNESLSSLTPQEKKWIVRGLIITNLATILGIAITIAVNRNNKKS